MVVVQLTTLKEALIQAWHHLLYTLELDLVDELIAPLQAGPTESHPSLTLLVKAMRELLERNWMVTINYAHKSVKSGSRCVSYYQQRTTGC